MKFRARKKVRVGPLVFHFAGPPPRMTSWGLHIGRWTWNAKTRRHTINTPGPGSLTFGGRKSEPRTRDSETRARPPRVRKPREELERDLERG